MAVRQIKLRGDPVLKRRCAPVKRFDTLLVQLLDDMVETMYASRGIGLAANQVGISQKVLVVDIGEGPHRLVNPRIVSREGTTVAVEGCLSVPQLWGEVERAHRVVIKAQDEHGHHRRIEAEGMLARVFQHEIDHLEGRLFVERATRLLEADEVTPEEVEGQAPPPSPGEDDYPPLRAVAG